MGHAKFPRDVLLDIACPFHGQLQVTAKCVKSKGDSLHENILFRKKIIGNDILF
ncbi:hypothetical protein DESPIG_01306 [Desulfovibrio piger ATCC 29098]|uniref:Uncharacterized protein n=1 Tax=Desulfovibrio piger ATCC 29098 TaxID=411464 RepID=B6WTA2_9BACT|nr:hypothetical protein DESPIG_01306 [Desulfovibrio piger ATCC 29098]